MTETRDPVGILERVRELEGEITSLVRSLDPKEAIGEHGATFETLEIGVGGTRLLIPLDQVREVVPIAWADPVIGAPDWVLGSMSYGSIPVTLIDLGCRVHATPTEIDPGLLTVIVEGARWLGLVVSEVGEVREIQVANLTTPGPELPCAKFLLGTVPAENGKSMPVLSIRRVGRDLDD